VDYSIIAKHVALAVSAGKYKIICVKAHSLFLASLVFITSLSADVVDVSSQIDSVTVYQGVAKVTRAFEVELPANAKETLLFPNLPQSINPSFVQIAVTDGAALNLGLSTFDNQFKESERSQSLRDLEDKLHALEAKKSSLENDRNALDALAKSRADLVKSINGGFARNGSKELYDLSKAAYDEAAAAAKDAFEKKNAIDESMRKLEEAIAVAKKDIEKQTDKEQATCGKYAVDAFSQGGKTKGTITYYVNGPSWDPTYIARADTAKGSVGIQMLAQVAQATGEDWNAITLYLETTKPGAGAKPEEPPVVFLNKQEFVRAYASKSINYEVAGSAQKLERSDEALQTLSMPIVATTNTATGFRAQVPGRVTVTSIDRQSGEAQPTVLPLLEKDAACEFHSETIPVSAETAFLIGKLKNPFPLPMLAGTMQAVVDGSTNGEGAIEETLPGDELTVGFGTNQNVTVERKTVAEKGGNSGIFGGKRVEKRSYTTKITNHMSVAQRIVARDSVPIAKDEKIVVEIQQPKNPTIDPEKALFDREITLKPGESAELSTSFTVTFPADWKITGGY
jgi:uncharacterized protein (TIGR02231 family)